MASRIPGSVGSASLYYPYDESEPPLPEYLPEYVGTSQPKVGPASLVDRGPYSPWPSALTARPNQGLFFSSPHIASVGSIAPRAGPATHQRAEANRKNEIALLWTVAHHLIAAIRMLDEALRELEQATKSFKNVKRGVDLPVEVVSSVGKVVEEVGLKNFRYLSKHFNLLLKSGKRLENVVGGKKMIRVRRELLKAIGEELRDKISDEVKDKSAESGKKVHHAENGLLGLTWACGWAVIVLYLHFEEPSYWAMTWLNRRQGVRALSTSADETQEQMEEGIKQVAQWRASALSALRGVEARIRAKNRRCGKK